jgi:hypothetical protein
MPRGLIGCTAGKKSPGGNYNEKDFEKLPDERICCSLGLTPCTECRVRLPEDFTPVLKNNIKNKLSK